MSLARSTYYYQLKNRKRVLARERSDADLKERIDEIHMEFPCYGYRFLQEELKRRGHPINTKRIRRIQHKFGLFPVRLRKFVRTTDSKHSCRIYPNLLKKAIETRAPGPACMHHSDRGVQYACNEYIKLLKKCGFQISMSRRGNPYDNAAMESFMKTLKYNEVYLKNYDTYVDVLNHLPEFLEEVYNKRRFHSSLGYLTPSEYEGRIKQSTMEAAAHLNLADWLSNDRGALHFKIST